MLGYRYENYFTIVSFMGLNLEDIVLSFCYYRDETYDLLASGNEVVVKIQCWFHIPLQKMDCPVRTACLDHVSIGDSGTFLMFDSYQPELLSFGFHCIHKDRGRLCDREVCVSMKAQGLWSRHKTLLGHQTGENEKGFFKRIKESVTHVKITSN